MNDHELKDGEIGRLWVVDYQYLAWVHNVLVGYTGSYIGLCLGGLVICLASLMNVCQTWFYLGLFWVCFGLLCVCYFGGILVSCLRLFPLHMGVLPVLGRTSRWAHLVRLFFGRFLGLVFGLLLGTVEGFSSMKFLLSSILCTIPNFPRANLGLIFLLFINYKSLQMPNILHATSSGTMRNFNVLDLWITHDNSGSLNQTHQESHRDFEPGPFSRFRLRHL